MSVIRRDLIDTWRRKIYYCPSKCWDRSDNKNVSSGNNSYCSFVIKLFFVFYRHRELSDSESLTKNFRLYNFFAFRYLKYIIVCSFIETNRQSKNWFIIIHIRDLFLNSFIVHFERYSIKNVHIIHPLIRITSFIIQCAIFSFKILSPGSAEPTLNKFRWYCIISKSSDSQL